MYLIPNISDLVRVKVKDLEQHLMQKLRFLLLPILSKLIVFCTYMSIRF